VRAITTTLDEAKSLGAMALFGEKYGDVVRMVEVGDGTWSRELCGGTHVRTTAEIGVFKITSEASSSANVRRIEALTGPGAVELLRRHDRLLGETAAALRVPVERAAESASEAIRARREAEKKLKAGAGAAAPALDTQDAFDVDGVRVLIQQIDVPDAKALPDMADRLRGALGERSVVVLGSAGEGRVSLIASATPAAVERGVKAGAIVKTAAQVVGGGGGGRDTMAQAGGRDPDKLPDALAAARAEIERALS
jgi:alanyl-tRNA synthetase